MKKNVIVIKEDVEIAPRVFLSKGDTLVEMKKGRWTIFEADADEDEKEDDKKEESDDSDEDDKVEESDEDDAEDEKKESAADDKKMAALRAKKK